MLEKSGGWSWHWYATPYGLVKWWGVATAIHIMRQIRRKRTQKQSTTEKWTIVMSEKAVILWKSSAISWQINATIQEKKKAKLRFASIYMICVHKKITKQNVRAACGFHFTFGMRISGAEKVIAVFVFMCLFFLSPVLDEFHRKCRTFALKFDCSYFRFWLCDLFTWAYVEWSVHIGCCIC